MNLYRELSNYCVWGEIRQAIELLNDKNNEYVDLTRNEGGVFRHTIQQNNSELLTALLKYYHNHKLNCDCNSMEYKQAFFELRLVLERAERVYNNGAYKFSAEIKKILDPYLPLEDDDDSQAGDLSDDSDYSSSSCSDEEVEVSHDGDESFEWPEHIRASSALGSEHIRSGSTIAGADSVDGSV